MLRLIPIPEPGANGFHISNGLPSPIDPYNPNEIHVINGLDCLPTPNGVQQSYMNGFQDPKLNAFNTPRADEVNDSQILGLQATQLKGITPSRTNGVRHVATNGYHISDLNGTHASQTQKPVPIRPTQTVEASQQRLLVFSAHNEVSLQNMISKYKEFMERESFQLSDLAYTLSVRRQHLSVRSFCVSDGQAFQVAQTMRSRTVKGLLFIFTSQGAQWPGMGRELLRDFACFHEDVQSMDAWLAESSHPPSWKIEGMQNLGWHRIFTDRGVQTFCKTLATAAPQCMLSQSVQLFKSAWSTSSADGEFFPPQWWVTLVAKLLLHTLLVHTE